MTATRTVTLWCDHGRGTDGRMGCVEWTAGNAATTKDARYDARKMGWRYVPGHRGMRGFGRDLCPQHAADARATGA